jgi:hypothetical protein
VGDAIAQLGVVHAHALGHPEHRHAAVALGAHQPSGSTLAAVLVHDHAALAGDHLGV